VGSNELATHALRAGVKVREQTSAKDVHGTLTTFHARSRIWAHPVPRTRRTFAAVPFCAATAAPVIDFADPTIAEHMEALRAFDLKILFTAVPTSVVAVFTTATFVTENQNKDHKVHRGLT